MSRLKQAQPAIRTGQKARIALSGPTGAGKTWTALIIASELAGPDGRILVIDTERGSASLYSDTFKFDTLDWRPPYDPREVAETITEAGRDYSVVVIDSLTHFWQGEGGTLDIVEASASRSSGNKFAGWKVGTPAQTAFVEAMLSVDAHVVATMRSKMEHVLQPGPGGKTMPVKVGMAPIQRDGIEYEFTVGGELDLDHRLTITKSRCAEIADVVFQGHQTKNMAATVRDWLDAAPAVNLWPHILEAVPTKEAREALAREWATVFPDFKTTAVPVEREEEARKLVATYIPSRIGAPANDGDGNKATQSVNQQTKKKQSSSPKQKLEPITDMSNMVERLQKEAPHKADELKAYWDKVAPGTKADAVPVAAAEAIKQKIDDLIDEAKRADEPVVDEETGEILEPNVDNPVAGLKKTLESTEAPEGWETN